MQWEGMKQTRRDRKDVFLSGAEGKFVKLCGSRFERRVGRNVGAAHESVHYLVECFLDLGFLPAGLPASLPVNHQNIVQHVLASPPHRVDIRSAPCLCVKSTSLTMLPLLPPTPGPPDPPFPTTFVRYTE